MPDYEDLEAIGDLYARRLIWARRSGWVLATCVGIGVIVAASLTSFRSNTSSDLGQDVTPDANLPPVARPDFTTLETLSVARIRVLDNDEDPDGDEVRLRRIVETVGGVASVRGDVVEFVPSPTAASARVDYEVEDADGATEAGTLSIDIAGGHHDNLFALPDTFPLGQDSVLLPVLQNDSWSDGGAPQLVRVEGVQGGTATIEGDRILFTPELGDADPALSYVVRVEDGSEETARVRFALDQSWARAEPLGEVNPRLADAVDDLGGALALERIGSITIILGPTGVVAVGPDLSVRSVRQFAESDSLPALIGPDADLAISNVDGRDPQLVVLDRSSDQIIRLPASQGAGGPLDGTVDDAGGLLDVFAGFGGAVLALGSDGSLEVVADGASDLEPVDLSIFGTLPEPDAVVAGDTAGRVAAVIDDEIVIVQPDGTASGRIDLASLSTDQDQGITPAVTALVFGMDGELLVSEGTSGRVWRIGDGEVPEVLAGGGADPVDSSSRAQLVDVGQPIDLERWRDDRLLILSADGPEIVAVS